MKKTKIKPTKMNLTVVIEKEYRDYLFKLSFKMSTDEGMRVGLSEIVRRALESRYPIPNDQLEMEI